MLTVIEREIMETLLTFHKGHYVMARDQFDALSERVKKTRYGRMLKNSMNFAARRIRQLESELFAKETK